MLAGDKKKKELVGGTNLATLWSFNLSEEEG